MTALDFSIVTQAWPYLWSGLQFSLLLTAVAFLTGMVLGTGFALVQHLEVPVLSQIVRAYIALIRSIPLILVLFWFFFLVPIVLGHLSGNGRPVPVGATYTAFITFGLFEAAYYSEIMRAGIQSVPKGQVSAGYAVGMTYAQCMRYIVLPQAFRNMLPVLLTQTIILFQDTSLVYAVGAYDLLKGFEVAGKNFNRPVEMYLLAAVTYFVICFSLSMLVRRLQKKIAIIR